ncbi:MAG: hypothetical protein EBV83_08575 [Verrucomicrobia bacterium]|nr:hypothetical protein [Verrucomicrobiota bacterium]
MAPEWFYLVSPLIALAVMVVVQAVVLRRRRGEQFFGSVVAGFTAGLLTVLSSQAVLLLIFPRNPDRWVLALVANPTIYVMLAYCFYNFINLGHASIRIRIFKECDDRGGFIKYEELQAVYDEKRIQEARLQRLLESGDIVREGGRWKLVNPRFVPVAKIVFGLKKFVLRRESEFEIKP